MFAWILAAFVVITGFVGAMMPPLAQNTLQGELNKRFGPFKRLEVKAPTDPSKLIHGYFDRLEVNAEGFQVQGLGISRANIVTSPVQFSVCQLVAGKPVLNYDVLATASAQLNENDFKAWFQTPPVKEKFKHIPIPEGVLNAKEASLENPTLRFYENRLEVAGTLLVSGTSLPFNVSGAPALRDQHLYFDQVQISLMGMALPSFLYENAFRSPVQLPKAEGADYQIKRISVHPGVLDVVTALTIKDAK